MHVGLRKALVTTALFSTSLAKVVIVSVSGMGFGPLNIQANVGDEIKISFTVGTASFVQSSLSQPCVPVSGGFNSGIVTIPPGQGPQAYTFILPTSDPLFFFNSDTQTTNQCMNGFVAAINAPPAQLSQFLSNAKNDPIFPVNSQTIPPQPVTPVLPLPFSTLPDSSHTPIASNGADPTSSQELAFDSNSVPVSVPLPSSDHAISQSISQASSQPSLPTTPSPGASETASAFPPGKPPLTSMVPSMSLSSSPTTTREIPGQTSQAVPAGSSNMGHNSHSTRIIVVVLGILFGVATLLGGIVACVVIKRRRGPGALLPQAHRAYPNISDGRSGLNSVGRAIRSLRRVLARLAGVLLWRHLEFNRLEEKYERRVSPYLAPVIPLAMEEKARRSHTAPVQERRLSEATLVPSVRGSETSDQSDTSDMSLAVNVPGSEKGVKDGADTAKSDRLGYM